MSSTCRDSVPGCCSSFTVLPPAVFCPRPSCQVRFPPVRRLSWYLKSSGSALYSTAGLQKLKLDAAGGIKASNMMIKQPELTIITDNVKIAWNLHCKNLLASAWLENKSRRWTQPDTLSFRNDLILMFVLVSALMKQRRHEEMFKAIRAWTSSGVIPGSRRSGVTITLCRPCRWMSELWDKQLSHHYQEACRQTSKPTQQQVASLHPVIKESVQLQ